MPESIQSFVDRLHEQGIEAGRREAEQIKNEAQAHADALVKMAEERAARILDRAEEERRKARHQLDVELRLAARDAVLRLQSVVTRSVKRLLQEKTGPVLEDPAFLAALIREVVSAYARSEAGRSATMEINLSPDAMKQLNAGLIHELKQGTKPSIALREALAEAGFEYRTDGAVHEITRQSVVEVLASMVSPEVREILEEALETDQDVNVPDPAEDARAELSSSL